MEVTADGEMFRTDSRVRSNFYGRLFDMDVVGDTVVAWGPYEDDVN